MEPVIGTGRAEVSETAEMFDDGWCGPGAAFTLQARESVRMMEFMAWTPPGEPGGVQRVTVGVGQRAPFAVDLPRGGLVRVQVACPVPGGGSARVRIGSDPVMAGSGEDGRHLSFVMRGLCFR